MNSNRKYNFLTLGMLVAYAALSGCTNSGLSSSGSLYDTNTGTTTATTTSAITVTPGSSSVSASGSVQFSASGGSGTYTYSISSPTSGGGSITSDGFYTAPSSTAAVVIAVMDTNGTYGFATVTVTATVATATTLTLTAASSSLDVGTGTQLTASGGTAPYTYAVYLPSSGGGTITTSGLYTAPSTITSSGFVVDVEVTDAAGTKAYVSLTITNSATATTCDGSFSAIFNGSQYSMTIVENATSGAIAGYMTWVKGGTQAIVGSCLNGTITFTRSGTDQIMTGTYTGTTGALSLAGNSSNEIDFYNAGF